ncbi:DSD1 family PLP-dependent enzyme [Sphingomonas sp. MMS24-J13]|uniref:DSD1 family PLP-dependent enzyme n=1 Tax=Sphingomonas sp. MMS24-J13 TaxID=3238686 RepID=UPI00384AB0B9
MTRDDLPTPALIVQLAALDRNIATMAAWAAERGITIRPHAKTHKSSEVARRQIAAGAVGICCAKLGEAEALAAEGIEDILITSPIASAQAIARLADLRRRIATLAIVVDHPQQVDRLVAGMAGQTIDVLVDIDPGMHRTGVTSADAAIALAGQIRAAGTLDYRGVQFYCGNLQHVTTVAERREKLAERSLYLAAIITRLRDAGLAPEIVTGGGSGTFVIDAELGILNELQPGSYIFMDREYRDCEFAGPQFEASLAIDTRVISANTPGCVTIDAGIKAMATEAGPPVVLDGADPASLYRFMGDEQGMLVTPPAAPDPELDARVTLLTPHCDPTVNLYDRYAVCDGEDVIGFWPVSARGRSG